MVWVEGRKEREEGGRERLGRREPLGVEVESREGVEVRGGRECGARTKESRFAWAMRRGSGVWPRAR